MLRSNKGLKNSKSRERGRNRKKKKRIREEGEGKSSERCTVESLSREGKGDRLDAHFQRVLLRADGGGGGLRGRLDWGK